MALDELLKQLQSNASEIEARRYTANKALNNFIAQKAMEAAQADPSGGGGGRRGHLAQAGNRGEVDVSGVDPNAPMRTVKFRGQSYTVNSTVAPRFQKFLRALGRQGYVPKSIGGYNKRNIAGTNTPSLHSYGLAIDIDPGGNGVQYGSKFNTTLPSNVGKLANRYGLVWGGDWKGSKKDPMHFSVPYFGTK